MEEIIMTNNPEVELIRAAGGLLWRDSPRGKEIAIIHRKRYKDWTLPKGKLDNGEDWQTAAIREVQEETGYDVQIEDFAGITCHMHDNRPKVVLYWNMRLLEEQKESPQKQIDSQEVDKVKWMTIQEALGRLDYENEKALIAYQSRETRRKQSLGSRIKRWWGRLWRSDSARRLASSIAAYRVEFEHLVARLQEEEGETDASWVDYSQILLDKAQQALDDNNPDLGWQCFQAAQRMELHYLYQLEPNLGFRARAQSILNEARDKLSSWRKKTIEDLLTDGPKLKDKLDVTVVYFASQILAERHSNVYHRLKIVKRQFWILAIVACLSTIVWVFLAPQLVDGQTNIGDLEFAVSVAMLGTTGACTSGILTLANSSIQTQIPKKLLESWVTLARPLVGAIAALTIHLFLLSGLLDFGEVKTGLILSVAFAAGFSERLLIRAVETVAK